MHITSVFDFDCSCCESRAVEWSGEVERWSGSVARSGGVELWSGAVEWSGGVERWSGAVEWSDGVERWSGAVTPLHNPFGAVQLLYK